MKGFEGGPSTVVALFTYGDVVMQTHNCMVRDAVFAARTSALCEAQAKTLGEACAAVEGDDEAVQRIMKAVEPLHNWPISVTHPPQDALIDRSRAVCAKNFLECTDADVLVMIDHDQEWVGPQCDDEHNAVYEGDICHIARLCGETKGIVGAAVSKKVRGQGIAVLWKKEDMDRGMSFQLGERGLFPCHYVGSAFTAYHRDVLQGVTDSMSEIPPGFAPIFLPVVAEHPNEPGGELHLSEDWALAHRAAALGHPVHVASRPLIRHYGMYGYGVIEDAMADPTPRRRISLLHASRGRPQMALEARAAWMSKISGKHEIEYILSLDNDDPAEYSKRGITVIRNDNRGPVDAWNCAFEASTGDILVQMHDDILEPPEHWDMHIAQRLDIEEPRLLHVSDGCECNPEKPWLVTISIGTRKWFKKLGGIFYPGYVSVFCDDDASLKAQQDECLVDAKVLTFKHRFEGAERDETQRRSYAPENWESGSKLLSEREAAGFPDFEG